MHANRKPLITLIQQQAIPADKIDEALRVTGVIPDNRRWRNFVDQLLLWVGTLALAFSLLFFIAYNWNEFGRFARFAIVEICMILTVAAYWKLSIQPVMGKVLLMVATVLLGVLLALYGQTYQTGADTWQLFFNWALLAIPWVIVARFPALWILWLSLINVSLIFYFQVFRGFFGGALAGALFGSDHDLFWILFIFNTLALAAWEWLALKKWDWLDERWATRLLAVGGGIPITWRLLFDIMDNHGETFPTAILWLAWLGGIYYVYRKLKPDLFMLAGICLSAIVIIVTFIAKHLLTGNTYTGGFLLLAILVIGLGTGAALWLKKIHEEMQS